MNGAVDAGGDSRIEGETRTDVPQQTRTLGRMGEIDHAFQQHRDVRPIFGKFCRPATDSNSNRDGLLRQLRKNGQ